MAEAISTLFVTEKNKLHSTSGWLVLVEIQLDASTALRAVENNANFSWNSQTWYAASLSVSAMKTNADGTLEGLSIGIANQPAVPRAGSSTTNYDNDAIQKIKGLIESGSLDDKPVRIFRVHRTSGATDFTEFSGQVLSTTISEEAIQVEIGQVNLIELPFPAERFHRSICRWIYQSSQCGYKGSIATCDKTFNGVNGCIKHGNDELQNGLTVLHPERFGGFPLILKPHQ